MLVVALQHAEIGLLAAELFLAVALGNVEVETVVELMAVETEKLAAVELFLAAAEQTLVVVLEIAEIVVELLLAVTEQTFVVVLEIVVDPPAAELLLAVVVVLKAAVPVHVGCAVELFLPVVLKAVG